MPFSIDRVVPWGRSPAEYRAMFALDETHLGGRILGCGDGPASFNAELSAQGSTVVSVDPLYAVSAAAIERRVEETFDEVMDQFDLAFHVRALEEMLRVAVEVRVFPLPQIGGTPSRHVEGVVDAFGSRGAGATVEPVAYEFQRGGNRMLRLRRKHTTQRRTG